MVESFGFVHPTFSRKPFKVLKQESDIIPGTISKSFPSLHAVWTIAGRKAHAKKGDRKEGIALFQVTGGGSWEWGGGSGEDVAVEQRLEHLDLLGTACGRWEERPRMALEFLWFQQLGRWWWHLADRQSLPWGLCVHTCVLGWEQHGEWVLFGYMLWPAWLTWLEHCPVHQKVTGLIPGQGTYVGCRFDAQPVCVQEATKWCFSLTLIFLSVCPCQTHSLNNNKVVAPFWLY